MKAKKERFTTVGVLFPGNRRVYTYRVPVGHKIKLGDELIVDTPYGGPHVVFTVRIDKRTQLPQGYCSVESLTPIRARLVNL